MQAISRSASIASWAMRGDSDSSVHVEVDPIVPEMDPLQASARGAPTRLLPPGPIRFTTLAFHALDASDASGQHYRRSGSLLLLLVQNGLGRFVIAHALATAREAGEAVVDGLGRFVVRVVRGRSRQLGRRVRPLGDPGRGRVGRRRRGRRGEVVAARVAVVDAGPCASVGDAGDAGIGEGDWSKLWGFALW